MGTSCSDNVAAKIEYPAVRYCEPFSEHRFTHLLLKTEDDFLVWRRSAEWPEKGMYIPGGILDSSGQHFRFIGFHNWRSKPNFLPGWISTLLLGPVRLEPIFKFEGTLSLEEFKNIWCKHVLRSYQRGDKRLIMSGNSYNECIRAVYGIDDE